MSDDGIKIIGVEFHYVWVDETGDRMSPIHKSLGTAMNFVSDWHENFDRISSRLADLRHNEGESGLDHWEQRRLTAAIKRMDKLTSTGKPPVTLRRLVVTTTLEDPDEDDLSVAAKILEASKKSAKAKGW